MQWTYTLKRSDGASHLMVTSRTIRLNYHTKKQRSLGNVGIRRFVFTNVQAGNYDTSSGDDEGNCVFNETGIKIVDRTGVSFIKIMETWSLMNLTKYGEG